MKRLPIFQTLLAALAPLPALLVATALVFPAPASADPAAAKLTLTVTDIKDHTGALMVAVFDQAGYDTDKQVTALMIPVSGATASASVDIPAGDYGIKLFHDVDGDGKMATNPFGMPIEPFGFSNNAPAKFGPAVWADAKFTVSAPATTHTIKLQ